MTQVKQTLPVDDVMRLIDRFLRSGRIYEADVVAGDLIQSMPLFGRGLNLASQVKQRRFDLTAAEKLGRMSVLSNPESWPIYANYGKVCALLTRTDISLKILNRCNLMEPNNKAILTQLGLTYLVEGHWRKGFEYYESRGSRETFEDDMQAVKIPIWRGEDVAGKKFLLVSEQGAGDVIQFVRFAHILAERGAHVTVSCIDELHDIIASATGVEKVIGPRVKNFDYAELILSLPLKLGLDESQVCFAPRYLFAGKDGLPLADNGCLRVGVCWAGNPLHQSDWVRSMPIQQLAPLLAIDDVDFYSLQVGERAADITEYGDKIIDLSPHLVTFSDTAKVIEQLDLVISIDSSVAHLAGALGKPVWTLLSWNAEWRWERNAAHSPWYPSMRLFWQTKLGDWSSVFDQVIPALKAKLKS